MLDFEIQELSETSEWRDVLAAYLAAHETAKTSDAEFDGWMPRIMSIDGVEDEELPRIHGKLIAWGFLKFQLASRGTGVVYQISSAGRQTLENLPGPGSPSCDNEADQADELSESDVTEQAA